jgi:hypothetical protein
VVGVGSAKLSAATALATSAALPENVNYAVKSRFLLSFLESVPEVSAKLKEPNSLQTATPKFDDVMKSAEQAAVLVLDRAFASDRGMKNAVGVVHQPAPVRSKTKLVQARSITVPLPAPASRAWANGLR